MTCPDIFEPVGFRDIGSSHLRNSDIQVSVAGNPHHLAGAENNTKLGGKIQKTDLEFVTF